MLVRVLGPVTVTGDNSAQAQLRPRERALLAVLLLHAGQPCQTGTLAGWLWEENPPRHPDRAVQFHARRIRRELESQGLPPLVTVLYRAYRADPPPGSLDLHRFRSFLAAARLAHSAGDRESATELAEKALACWPNGPGPLPDLPDTPRFTAIASQLAAQRHEALTWLTSVQLDLGRYQELIPVLEREGDTDARHRSPR
jgi:DNA-binding SARP family transcriptional activator